MSNRDPDWGLYRSFLAVLEHGSLSAAARALALTQPTLARHVESLEAALGVALFVRSQQGLSPTAAALALRPYAEQLAATAAAMLRAASGHDGPADGPVSGTVRVTASAIIGAEVLPAVIAALQERHPGLAVELVASNAVGNLLRRDADIAVRNVEPAQDALVVRRLGTVTVGLHAHRRYLDRAGRPRRLDDLHAHSVIGFDRETPEIRSLRRRSEALDRIAGLRFALRTDSEVAQLNAIRAGVGIGICQVALARRSAGLERVLAGAFALPLPVFLAMHEDLRATPRCRAAFDGLAAGLRPHLD